MLVPVACRRARSPLPAEAHSASESRSNRPPLRGAVEKVANVPAEPVCNEGLPIPIGCNSPWAPPGIAGPWPHDEYLEDGGDRDVQVNLGPEGEVRGLELEDTVAIYDTIDGRTIIEPSNRVCLYSPRFAAVRKVDERVAESSRAISRSASQLPVKPNLHQEDHLATTRRAAGPARGRNRHQATQHRARATKAPCRPSAGSRSRRSTAVSRRTKTFACMRQGIFEESEKARLIEAVRRGHRLVARQGRAGHARRPSRRVGHRATRRRKSRSASTSRIILACG